MFSRILNLRIFSPYFVWFLGLQREIFVVKINSYIGYILSIYISIEEVYLLEKDRKENFVKTRDELIPNPMQILPVTLKGPSMSFSSDFILILSCFYKGIKFGLNQDKIWKSESVRNLDKIGITLEKHFIRILSE